MDRSQRWQSILLILVTVQHIRWKCLLCIITFLKPPILSMSHLNARMLQGRWPLTQDSSLPFIRGSHLFLDMLSDLWPIPPLPPPSSFRPFWSFLNTFILLLSLNGQRIWFHGSSSFLLPLNLWLLLSSFQLIQCFLLHRWGFGLLFG